jgi:hypothetical protein
MRRESSPETTRWRKISSAMFRYQHYLPAAVSFLRLLSLRHLPTSSALSATENTGLTSWVTKPEGAAYRAGNIWDGPGNFPKIPEK